jgi:hypothetical protein
VVPGTSSSSFFLPPIASPIMPNSPACAPRARSQRQECQGASSRWNPALHGLGWRGAFAGADAIGFFSIALRWKVWLAHCTLRSLNSPAGEKAAWI